MFLSEAILLLVCIMVHVHQDGLRFEQILMLFTCMGGRSWIKQTDVLGGDRLKTAMRYTQQAG